VSADFSRLASIEVKHMKELSRLVTEVLSFAVFSSQAPGHLEEIEQSLDIANNHKNPSRIENIIESIHEFKR
jgi:hypothetical protein